jgi:hypothetical protein
LIVSPHNNQQLFSDHYLDVILPQRHDWNALTSEAEPIMAEIGALLAKYKPSDKEAQLEHDFIRPVLRVLGHAFEVQASLATPDGTKQPDYIFYRDEEALNANKGKKLTDTILQQGAFAVGDAKYWDCPLDIAMKGRSSDPFTNKNPSYQIAFYIQHSGLAWGILTNGRLWRLYHKQTAHKLDHYYEVDLPALLKSGNVKQFLYFYAFFCRAAFDQHPLSVAEILQESIDYAEGVGNSLKKQVYEALRHVAQGFLDFAPNQLSADDPAMLKDIYDNSLIILYRLLFILYAEARNLLPIQDSELYLENYSLRSMTHSIAKDLDADRILRSNSTRIYHGLKELFSFINVGDPPLKISTFNGGLFDPQHHAFLEKYEIGDARLQKAIDMLARTDTNGNTERHFIDYRDLSVRNLGTIYEGLLEYHLEKIEARDGWTIDLLNDKGERKATGSYYTPDYIVKYIVDQTVGPVLQDVVERAANEKGRVEAVLAIKVLDPAMGSGHFLVEATEYIARFMVELNAQPITTREAELAYWKRRVVQSCIYGIDLNPLAVELAKLSLWLSTVAKDRPLSFLNHHLRTGNALIGARLEDLTLVRNGNGNGAARKTKKVEAPREQLSLFNDDVFRQSMTTAVDLMWLVEDNPAQTVEQVKEQEQLYDTMHEGLIGKYGKLANLITSVSYGVAIDPALWKPLVDFATGRTTIELPQFKEWSDAAMAIADARRFFHWELEFPEVFFDRHGQAKKEEAGFEAVIGNPPWIRQEAFSEDKPALKRLFHVYHGVADLSTYFVELGNTYLKNGGRFGFIIPNKFVRANYGESLRTFLIGQVKLERLVDFGDLPVFAEAVTYPMIVLTSKQPQDDLPVKYTHLEHLQPDILAIAIEDGQALVPRSALTASHWALKGEGTDAIVEKMRAVSVPLGEYIADKIFYGIKTGFNEAFVIDRKTRDALIAKDPKSAEIIKPFVVGEDVKRYRLDYKERYIILSKIGTPIEQYPAVFAHLEQYQEQLEKRWDKGNHWWELRPCDYYNEFEKPKLMWPVISASNNFAFTRQVCYSNDKTFFIPTNDLCLLALLNSSTMFLFLRSELSLLRGGFLEYRAQTLVHAPIRRIAFTTPVDQRIALASEGVELYKSNDRQALPGFVEACLSRQPEQSDVVHDLLVYLAEQMMNLNRQRQQALEDFMLGLESVLSDTELQKIGRLWTPPNIQQAGDEDAAKRFADAEEKLGSLASQQLDLRDDIGLVNEEQWKWLLKRRLGKPDLVELTRVYRKFQPPIATLDKRIAITDHVIDEIVYRLYGLTVEEIDIVEGKQH